MSSNPGQAFPCREDSSSGLNSLSLNHRSGANATVLLCVSVRSWVAALIAPLMWAPLTISTGAQGCGVPLETEARNALLFSGLVFLVAAFAITPPPPTSSKLWSLVPCFHCYLSSVTLPVLAKATWSPPSLVSYRCISLLLVIFRTVMIS